jgi:hypothetical protein
MDPEEHILTLSMKDIEHNDVLSEMRTKILITVYLKKAGWNNTPLVLTKNQVSNLFINSP